LTKEKNRSILKELFEITHSIINDQVDPNIKFKHLCNYGMFLLESDQTEATTLLKEALSLNKAMQDNLQRVKDILVVFTKLGLTKEIEAFMSTDLQCL